MMIKPEFEKVCPICGITFNEGKLKVYCAYGCRNFALHMRAAYKYTRDRGLKFDSTLINKALVNVK